MNFDPNTGQPINNVQPAPVTTSVKKTNGFAIAGFIIALLFSAIIGLIFSIIGVSKAKKCNSGSGFAIAGIIISILKLIIEIVLVFLFGTVFLTFFGFAVANEVYCSQAYDCVQKSDGIAECKYRDTNNKEVYVTCPMTIDSTEKTTKNKSTELTGAKEYTVSDDYGIDNFYADKFYLIDNTVYARLTTTAPKSMKADYKVNGEKAVLVTDGVKNVYVVEFGQGGLVDVIVTDSNGQAYKILNYNSNGHELEKEKVDGAKNIKSVYSLLTADAWDYLYINNKNQIVVLEDKDYHIINFDKKNNISENLIGSDVIKLTYVKSEVKAADETDYYFEVTINGTKQSDYVIYRNNDELTAYEDIDLIQFEYCKSGSTYSFGDACN